VLFQDTEPISDHRSKREPMPVLNAVRVLGTFVGI
jgi:hypothetical protein